MQSHLQAPQGNCNEDLTFPFKGNKRQKSHDCRQLIVDFCSCQLPDESVLSLQPVVPCKLHSCTKTVLNNNKFCKYIESLIDTQIISMYIKICGETLYLGNTYHCWQCANYARDICSWGTDITSEMCSGAHISRGNIYHCNTGPMHIPEYCLIFSQFLPVIPKELV